LKNGFDHARLGIAATRKLGGAVVRNRAKRIIRDVFRRNKFARGYDVVVVPNRRLLEAGQNTFEAEFCQFLEERRLRR
jgi:ribonuclease P protein component